MRVKLATFRVCVNNAATELPNYIKVAARLLFTAKHKLMKY